MTYGKDFYDHHSQRVVSKKAAETAVCVACGRWQHVTAFAWKRAARPLCKSCGGILEPSARIQKVNPERKTKFKPEGPQRCCKNCHAVLRSGNTSELCSPCEREVWRKEREQLS